MLPHQSIELTEFKKPAGTTNSKHAPYISDIQLQTMPPVVLKELRVPSIGFLKFNRTASLAYSRQSEATKALPLSRFWKQPDTLTEQCIQAIAGQLLQDSKTDIRQNLPEGLNDRIDQLLNDAEKVLASEKLQEVINESNRRSTEQLLKFRLT